MFRWIVTVLLVSGFGAAAAQDTEMSMDNPCSDAPAAVIEFGTFESAQFGFTIDVPASGIVRSPMDPDWKMDPEIAMIWEGDDSDPISMVELRVDSIGNTMTPEQFDSYYLSLLSRWSDDAVKYSVTRAKEPPYRFGNMEWSIIEVVDKSHGADKMVYYTVFATYKDDTVYTIAFYYLEPVTKAVQDIAVPMMKSFNSGG